MTDRNHIRRFDEMSFARWARCLALALIVTWGTVQAGEPAGPGFQRPKYNPVARDKEDWSVLAGQDPWQTGDLFDPIKYIALSDDGFIWTSFGGQLRLRYEAWENFATTESNDESLLLSRLRFHNDTHVGENLRFFFEGISALSTESTFRAGGLLDVNSVDLQQAFFDLTVPLSEEEADDPISLTVRGGRQELLFGKQRLVSPLDWSNTRRTWDGVKATLDLADWSIAAFWTQFVPVHKFAADTADAQHEFYGVYATGGAPLIDNATLDLYYLGRDRSDAIGVPSHRLHRSSGQFIVTLNVRDFYIGPHGSPVSTAVSVPRSPSSRRSVDVGE